MLACHHNKVGLGQLESAVLEHADLMQQCTSLVRECLVVPDAVRLDFEDLKDLLKTTLQNVDHSLVSSVFSFYLFRLLLSAVDLTHDLLYLLAALGEIVLGGISDAIVSMPLNLPIEIFDLLDELLGLGVELRHIVV